MLPISKTIALLCGMVPNWVPNNNCKPYLYECIYGEQNVVQESSDQNMNCLNKYLILNNSWRPANAVVGCYRQKKVRREKCTPTK